MSQRYVPDPNPDRISWIFVSISKTTNNSLTNYAFPGINGWEIGAGNPERLVYTATSQDTDKECDYAVDSLGSELASFQDADNLLVTPRRETLQLIRCDLFSLHKQREATKESRVVDAIQRPTLHGFRHIALKDILTEYFGTDEIQGQENQTGDNFEFLSVSPETMWQISRTTIPLLPIEISRGQAL